MTATKHKSTLAKNAAEGKRFGVVVSRYHDDICNALLNGALETLESHGAKKSHVTTVWVPGSFEIPLAARALAHASPAPDAVICLGVIVKGETTHDEYIAREAARGIAQVGLTSGIPVIFGILTTQTLEQAKARGGGAKGHKGVEAAESAIEMIQVLDEIKKGPTSVPGKNVGF